MRSSGGNLRKPKENPLARVLLARLEQQVIEPFREHEVEFLVCRQDRGKLTGCRDYALLAEALRCVVLQEAILPHAAGFDELIKRSGHEELPTLE